MLRIGEKNKKKFRKKKDIWREGDMERGRYGEREIWSERNGEGGREGGGEGGRGGGRGGGGKGRMKGKSMNNMTSSDTGW